MKPLIFCLISVGLATAVNSCPIGVNCSDWNTHDINPNQQQQSNQREER